MLCDGTSQNKYIKPRSHFDHSHFDILKSSDTNEKVFVGDVRARGLYFSLTILMNYPIFKLSQHFSKDLIFSSIKVVS